jgi:hypothetical protein
MGIVDAIKEIASHREVEDNWDSVRKQRNYMAHDYPDKEYIWASAITTVGLGRVALEYT